MQDCLQELFDQLVIGLNIMMHKNNQNMQTVHKISEAPAEQVSEVHQDQLRVSVSMV